MKNADPATQRKIANRLKRARGQLDAVIDAVENEGSCRDVVTQLSAVSTALDRAGFLIVSNAMKHCLNAAETDDASADASAATDSRPHEEDSLTIEELEKLFLSLA
ncbi:metal-sensitive transcriptional regulator [Brevibacterium antiquum]|uniref:metal-sensitive transcriptional regulator n=1 Tax=Brevibacterium antiquum TaxID=234835 RepID=UPI0018DFB6D2|nr:metal-sensitive transcriptional regulator [Brevibacterium antiquum]